MKNVNLILVAIILAGVFYLSFTEKSPAKPEGGEYEVMYAQVNNNSLEVTAVTGDKTETIPLNRKEYLKGKRDFIQKAYDEGWELKGIHSSPGSYFDLIFVRKN